VIINTIFGELQSNYSSIITQLGMAVGLRLPKVGVNQYRTHATARNTM